VAAAAAAAAGGAPGAGAAIRLAPCWKFNKFQGRAEWCLRYGVLIKNVKAYGSWEIENQCGSLSIHHIWRTETKVSSCLHRLYCINFSIILHN